MAQYNVSGKKKPKIFAGNINYIFFINIRIILITNPAEVYSKFEAFQIGEIFKV